MHVIIMPDSLISIDEPGIYTIILSAPKKRRLAVGSLGIRDYPAGYYCYTGSGRGPGGLKRVDRHILHSRGKNKTRRWHIDYLLAHASVLEVYITRTSKNVECQIASAIGGTIPVVPGFGCTDCLCSGHLHYSVELPCLRDAVAQAHRAAEADMASASFAR